MLCLISSSAVSLRFGVTDFWVTARGATAMAAVCESSSHTAQTWPKPLCSAVSISQPDAGFLVRICERARGEGLNYPLLSLLTKIGILTLAGVAIALSAFTTGTCDLSFGQPVSYWRLPAIEKLSNINKKKSQLKNGAA